MNNENNKLLAALVEGCGHAPTIKSGAGSMSTNEQLEADAKAFLVRRYTNIDGWLTDGWLERMTAFAAEQIAAERLRVCEWTRFDEDYPEMCDGGQWSDHVSIPPFCCVCGGKVKITEAK